MKPRSLHQDDNMEEQISIQKIVTEDCDSIEMGSPSKNSKVKIYGNFNNLEAFKNKIDNSKAIREYIEKMFNPII